MLFHISEEAGIERFEPRPSKYTDEPVVWALDADRLRNYLVPRDCPRVTYYASRTTTAANVERFLGSSPAVVAVESGCGPAGCIATTCRRKPSPASTSAPATS